MAEAQRLRLVLVDDEPLARKTLRLLARRDREVAIVAECRNGEEAVAAVREHRPDVMFLDVQMPGLSGFDVLERLEDEAPVIVFVTAYDQYAIRAFEVHAIDYLLKPFTDERFEKALARAKDVVRRQAVDEARGRMAKLAADHRGGGTRRFMVRSGGRVVFLKAEEIDWIEAADYYARLHVAGSTHLIRESMNDLEAALDPDAFVRIHRSAIVNLDRVREMRPLFRGELVVVLNDGTQLRMSRSRREELESRFRRRR
ncbi:MAG TPA: LytTR family DNA-binding domain-containing protein [Thermoanaerobaculia bacterium]|nr:LytTR family DNA-binding domain-containing protein [Thermoanaerobaculia bacterium]